jgi:hypothetical protein
MVWVAGLEITVKQDSIRLAILEPGFQLADFQFRNPRFLPVPQFGKESLLFYYNQ